MKIKNTFESRFPSILGLEPPPPPPPPPPPIKSAETVEEKICETTIDNQMSLNLSKVEEPINETMEKTNEQKEPLNESLVSDVQQSSPIDREKTEEKVKKEFRSIFHR